MHRRRIQLIAGTTYSVSMPKEWVKKNNLKEKDEVLMFERGDKRLVVSPDLMLDKNLSDISLNVDEYEHNIGQVLFAVYYLGAENITLFSKEKLTKDLKARIRKTLTRMSGTEVSYEDEKKITIKVLLDTSKVDLIQSMYRISLLIDSSITNILEKLSMNEATINEDEVDRLYHLIVKIISISMIDSNVLQSSKIRNITLVPSYFMISKRMENLADNIYYLSEYLHNSKKEFEDKKILLFIKDELHRTTNRMLKPTKVFTKTNPVDFEKIKKSVEKVKDKTIQTYLDDMVRYLEDIQEEIVNITFYKKMIKDNLL